MSVASRSPLAPESYAGREVVRHNGERGLVLSGYTGGRPCFQGWVEVLSTLPAWREAIFLDYPPELQVL